MATPGSLIENPVLGVRIKFLQTGRASAGHMLKMEWTVRPGGAREIVAHFHPEFDERFEIKSGEGQYRVDKEILACKAGDDLTLPRGIPHIHPWNSSGSEELVYIQSIHLPRPSIDSLERLENVLEQLAVMAQKGLVGKDGLPRHPLKKALALEGLLSLGYLAGQPVAAQKVLVAALAGMARRLGHRLG